jgi:hypothetical protein
MLVNNICDDFFKLRCTECWCDMYHDCRARLTDEPLLAPADCPFGALWVEVDGWHGLYEFHSYVRSIHRI